MSEPVYRRTRLTTSSSPAPAPTADALVIVPPEELVTLLGLTYEEAERVSALVQITVEAYLWPNTVPSPVPPPMHAAGLALAARFAGAELTRAGSIVGETIGSYSYRLATPLTFDSVVLVLGELADELAPWAPAWRSTAYDVVTAPAPLDWPADWWQRDLDRIYGEVT